MKRGDLQKASALWDESVALCTTHDLTELLQEGVTRQGWVLIESGRPEEGLARLREGVAKAEDKRMDATLSQARLAVALSRSGQIDEGLRLITEVLAREAASEMGLRLAWLHQTKGELLLMRHSVPQAEACFRESITIARAQQDRAQELAATTRLARLLTKLQKKRARTMLSAIYNQFIEGFDTADLRAAKLLLDQLNGK